MMMKTKRQWNWMKTEKEKKKDEEKKGHQNIIFKSACDIESNLRSWNKLNWNLSLGILIYYRLPEWFSDSISSSPFFKAICYFGLFLPFRFQVLRAFQMPSEFKSFLILARAIWIIDVIVGALKYRLICSFFCKRSVSTSFLSLFFGFSFWISIFILCCGSQEKRFWISINLLFSNSRFYLSGILILGILFIVLHMLMLVQPNPMWYTTYNDQPIQTNVRYVICENGNENENQISHPPSVLC